MYDIVSVGDTAVDMFLMLHEASVKCLLKTEVCQLCMNYAEKIPLQSVKSVPGVGSAPNNAVGSTRLGLKAGLYTTVGGDMAGNESLAVFKKEKVDTKFVKVDKKTLTSYSTVISFQGERTLLNYQVNRKYKLPKFKSKWIFLASLSDGHKFLHRQIVEKVKKDKIKLGFNPGSHELREGLKRLQAVIAVAEVFIVNKEEAWMLVDRTSNMKVLLKSLKEFGPKIVVVTDGANGAYCYDGENFYFQGIFDLPVLEKTGAGDAFATGFMAARIHNLSIQDSLRWGAANSASVVQKIGGQTGLMTKTQMLNFLKMHHEAQGKII